LTRFHCSGTLEAALSTKGRIIDVEVKIWEWQVRHVWVEGIPANAPVSTVEWQFLQSIRSSAAWWRWLKRTGCSGATPSRFQ
jgi:hypothetical protein